MCMVSVVTARRFAEFDTSVICHAVLILCLGSFLLQDMFQGSKYWLSRQRLKYSVNILLICILYCDAGPGYLIRTVCKLSALHEYHNYLSSSSFSSETAVTLLRESYSFF